MRVILPIVVLLWTAWCVRGLLVPARDWLPVFKGVAQAGLSSITATGLLLAPLRAAWPLLLCLAFGWSVLRAGRALTGLIAPGDATPMERRALSVLFGFAAVATAFFGLGLAGLFYFPILAAVVLAAALLPGAGGEVREIAGELRRVRLSPWWLGAVPFVIAAAAALAPDVYVDAYTYHMALPELFLKVHRFVWTPVQTPLSTELIYALGIGAGVDALPHLLQLVPYLAALSLLAGWAARRGGPWAGWLTLVAVLAMGETERQLQLSKNNLAAAAYPVAGVVCALRGLPGRSRSWLLAGAVLLGCGAAQKWSGYLLLALGGVFAASGRRPGGRPGFRDAAVWVLAAAAPLVPWLVRTWLDTGDPLWPFLSRLIPGALWDQESSAAMAMLRSPDGPALTALKLGPHWVEWWVRNQPGVVLFLPACLAGFSRLPGDVKAMLGYSALGYAALWTMIPGDAPRLGLGVHALAAGGMSVVAARTIAAWPSGRRTAALAAGLGLAFLPLGFALRDADPRLLLNYLAGGIDQRGYIAARLSTYGELAAGLRKVPGVRGVIALGGDRRSYRLPGRYHGPRFFGRNWAWVVTKERADTDGIRKSLRQLNCRHIIYNFVTEGFPHRNTTAFDWDERQLRLWVEFVGRHLGIVVVPAHVDHANGGWCAYELRSVPLPEAPEFLPYLPGLAALYYRVTHPGLTGGRSTWLEEGLKLQARFPDVDFISDMVALPYRVGGQWNAAYRYYLPGVTHGTVNDSNYWNIGIMAGNLRRWREAYIYLNRAWELYPHLREDCSRVLKKVRRILAEGDRNVRFHVGPVPNEPEKL